MSKTHNFPVNGLIKYYNLQDWWLGELSSEDRVRIIESYKKCEDGSFSISIDEDDSDEDYEVSFGDNHNITGLVTGFYFSEEVRFENKEDLESFANNEADEYSFDQKSNDTPLNIFEGMISCNEKPQQFYTDLKILNKAENLVKAGLYTKLNNLYSAVIANFSNSGYGEVVEYESILRKMVRISDVVAQEMYAEHLERCEPCELDDEEDTLQKKIDINNFELPWGEGFYRLVERLEGQEKYEEALVLSSKAYEKGWKFDAHNDWSEKLEALKEMVKYNR